MLVQRLRPHTLAAAASGDVRLSVCLSANRLAGRRILRLPVHRSVHSQRSGVSVRGSSVAVRPASGASHVAPAAMSPLYAVVYGDPRRSTGETLVWLLGLGAFDRLLRFQPCHHCIKPSQQQAGEPIRVSLPAIEEERVAARRHRCSELESGVYTLTLCSSERNVLEMSGSLKRLIPREVTRTPRLKEVSASADGGPEVV
ncbi:hypothetical protein EYF80_040694 [Liparis tanakae]|uniref:Uncharacterized protein n=1 Tax=Liparis tanakae TaxID=230148 RepID=A0A4Z2G6E8_9TELE|nr:hypothetical protein EYF80_040694 [Liparis tanakae]